MTPPRWLFWRRRDLRLADNLGLAAAAAATPAVTGVVVLDPAELAAAQQARPGAEPCASTRSLWDESLDMSYLIMQGEQTRRLLTSGMTARHSTLFTL